MNGMKITGASYLQLKNNSKSNSRQSDTYHGFGIWRNRFDFGKNMLDADAISQYVDSEKFSVSLSEPTSTRHIVLNTTNDILSDTTVRQALQYATNRQAISDGIFYGLEEPADTLYAKQYLIAM